MSHHSYFVTGLVTMTLVAMVTCNSLDRYLGNMFLTGNAGKNKLKNTQGDYHTNDAEHGGVAMGVLNDKCDDGKVNLWVDWDESTDEAYQCQENRGYATNNKIKPLVKCLKKSEIPSPVHVCMKNKIEYPDKPPMAGSHRPIWPVYGEYSYIPPQRWVHALEHGAAVFLYHPCADPDQIKTLKNVAKNCLRRHIITPYRDLAPNMNFAVIAYGCRLQMNTVDVYRVQNFVTAHAMKAPEHRVSRHGDYDEKLVHKADIVSDVDDTVLCPVEPLLTAETMSDKK